MPSPPTRLLALMIVAITVVACGNKGPLRLPDKPATAPTETAPVSEPAPAPTTVAPAEPAK